MKSRRNVFEFERHLTPGGSPGKNFQKYTDTSSFQMIWGRAWGEVGREDKNQVREMQTSLKIVRCHTQNSDISVNLYFRHSDDPANFIPFGKFHCSVRGTPLNNAVRDEGRRKNRTKWGSVHTRHRYLNSPGITRELHLPTQSVMVQRHPLAPQPFLHPPCLVFLQCFLLKSIPFIHKSKRHR